MKLKIKGNVRIIEAGRVVVNTPNLVTDIGVELIRALLTGGYGSPSVGGDAMSDTSDMRDFTISEMRLTLAASPAAPEAEDSALEGDVVWTANREVGQDSVLNYDFPEAGQIQFDTLIPATSALDGDTLTEEGLFNENGRLIARATFSQMKTNGLALTVIHTFTISAA